MTDPDKTPAYIRSGATVFLVSDVVRSADYYRDALGFRYDRFWGDPPGFCMVWRDEQCFMLSQVDDQSAIRPVSTIVPAVWDAYLWVDDVDALYDELMARGAAIEHEPIVKHYDVKEFVVLDPDGHKIAFGEELDDSELTLHRLLDTLFGADGDHRLEAMLQEHPDLAAREGALSETPLHVAVRRRRLSAVKMLVEHGAELDARNAAGKTAYAHAVRRGFVDVAAWLADRGSDTTLADPDRLAVALSGGRLDEARALLAEDPALARTGNPEEDRLLADMAGRMDTAPVALLLDHGADLSAPGMDDGSPLHQAAWFGAPENARLLIEAGAPLDIFDRVHWSSPIGWAVHGSRYSGGAEERQDMYVMLVEMLLDAGTALHYPNEPDGETYLRRLKKDASPAVLEVLDART